MLLKNLFAFLLIILNAQPAFSKHPNHAILVVDQESGKVLHEENADQIRYPASITKVMTLYLTFEAVKKGALNFNDELVTSKYAASMPRTNLGLKPGERIRVRDAIIGAALKSANDCAVLLSEVISGSEERFVSLMNERAKMLGMSQTYYANSSGLPNSQHKTSAYDIARIAIAIQRDFPEYYHLFSKKEFEFKGKKFKSTNNVLAKYNYHGATGLKTGFINASGFNIVTTVKRGSRKLVGVVLGGETAQVRDKRMMNILNKFLDPMDFNTIKLTKASEKVVNQKSKSKKVVNKKNNKKVKVAMN